MTERHDDIPTGDTLDRGLAAAFGPCPAARGVLETLAESIGPVPRVLLRDTAAGHDEPLVRPSSPAAPGGPGHYQLFGEIARGGMGLVLKGRDTDLGRDLAVKVLLEQHSDRPELVRRFVEEAQISGQLQHPGIVPVYELGAFGDARPYFTMMLVKGRTLAALLDARGNPADDRARFLGVFGQIAQTVAYAHARGVIHRDLKPSNVMVGAFGEVQVMDWGLAKVLKQGGSADDERSPATRPEASIIRTVRSGSAADASQAGSVLGTPAYMAPEQAGGDVDAVDERADVFGLGSILCEVLTGRPAYTGPTAREVLRKAARGDTANALARLDVCGAEDELVALTRSCPAAEPTARPRDAGQVAAAITAYQNSVVERLRSAELERAAEQVRAVEERRRRRVTLALAASVLATVLVAGGAAFWILQDRQARRAQLDLASQKAELLRDQATRATTGAVGKWQEARLAVENASGMLGATASEAARSRLADLKGSVERGTAAARADDELVERLDKIRAGMEGKQANAAYVEAFRAAGLDLDAPEAMSKRLIARPAAVREAVVTALDAWSVVSGEEAGEAGLERVLKAARVVDAADAFHNRLRDALERKDLEGFRRLAGQKDVLAEQGSVSLWLLGYSLESLGDHPLAVAVLRQGQRRFPGDYWLNLELGIALLEGKRNGVGTAAVAIGRWAADAKYQAAESYLTAAVALRPRFAAAHRTLGVAFHRQGKWEEAALAYRQAVAIDPTSSEAYARLGTVLVEQGNWDEGLAASRQAVTINPKSPRVHLSLGWVLSVHRELDAVEAEFREVIRLDPTGALGYVGLGWVLRETNRHDEAITALRQAITLDPTDPGAYENLGGTYSYQRKF